MLIAGQFTCDPPYGWKESRKGAAMRFKQSEHEMNVFAWAAHETKSKKKIKAELEDLCKEALSQMAKDSKNSNLIAELTLTEMDENGLHFWVQSFVTRDTTILYSSAVLRGEQAVLMATLNAPNRPESFPLFITFLQSVKPVSLPEAPVVE